MTVSFRTSCRRLLILAAALSLGWTLPANAATIQWASPVSGNWSDGTKWTGGVAPGAFDDAEITVAGTYTVTVDVSLTAKSVTVGAATGVQTLTIGSSRTLTLSGPTASSIGANASLTLNGGQLNGAGNVDVGGTFTWIGGTQSGTGTTMVQNTAVMNVTSPGYLDGRPLVISAGGTLNVTATNYFYIQNGASLTSSGTIDFPGDGGLYLNTGAGSITSSGIIRKSGGTGASTINVPLTTQSGSQFLVQSGTFNVAAVTSTASTFNVSSGATLNFNTNSTRTFDSASTISGAGTAQWQSGTNTFSGTISTPIAMSAGTLTLNNAAAQSIPTLTISGGTLNGTAPINVTAAAMTWTGGVIGGSGLLSIPGGTTITVSGVVYFDARPVSSAGTINVTGSNYIYMQNNAALTNAGTIDIQADGHIYLSGTAGTTSITNSGTGTITKSGGTGGSHISVPLTTLAGSQVLTQTGTLHFGPLASTGTAFTVASGATTNFYYAGVRTFDATSSISGAGSVEWAGGTNTVNAPYNITGTTKSSGATTTIGNITSVGSLHLTNGTLTLNTATALTVPTLTTSGGTLNGTAPINITGAAMTWSGGVIGGSGLLSIPGGTTITVSGVPYLDTRPVSNGGTINITGNNYIYMQNNAALTNSGTIDLLADGQLYISGTVGTTSVINAGTGVIRKSGGTGGSSISVPLTTQSGSQVLAQSGTLYLGDTAATGTTFTVSSGATLNFYYGNTRTFDATSTIDGAGTVEWQGPGTGTVSGAYNVTGTTKSSGGATTISNITSVGNLTIVTGTLTLNSATALTVPTLTISSGILGGTAPINLTSAAMTWSGGTLTGSGLLSIPLGTTITVSGVPYLDGRPVANAGIINITSGNYFYMLNNAALTNSGTIDIQADGQIYLSGTAGTTGITNTGTAILKKSGGSGISSISVALTTQTGSQLLAQSGSLYLGAVNSTGSTFTVSGGATLNFYGANTRTFDATSSISGAGTVDWQQGTNTVGAVYNVTGATRSLGATTTITNITSVGSIGMTSGTLTLDSATALTVPTLTMSGGTLNGTAPINITGAAMTWTGGVIGGTGLLSIPAGTTITVSGVPYFDTRPVSNGGTININATNYFYMQNNAVLTNGGTIDFLGDGQIYISGAVGTTSLTNGSTGIIRKSGGGGGSSITVPLTTTTGSQLLAQSGTLYLGTVTSTGSAFTVSAGATLSFYYSGNRTFDGTSSIGGAGTVEWQQGTNTVSGNYNVTGTTRSMGAAATTITNITSVGSITMSSGTLTLDSGPALTVPTLTMTGGTLNGTAPINLTSAAMTWSGGTIAGTGALSIPAGTTITINGYPAFDTRPVTNAGTINLNNGYIFYFQNNTVLTNTGTIDLLGDGSISMNGAVGSTAVINANLIRKSGGTGTGTFSVPLTAQSGSQFNVQSGAMNVGAVTSTAATFGVSAGATLNFNSNDTRTFDASSTISGGGLTQWQSGTTTISGTISTAIAMTGGTVTINSAAAQSIPTLAIGGGTLNGSAAINLTGAAMTWSGGTIGGTGALSIPAGTTITINGYPIFDTRSISNAGTINVNNGYYLYVQNNAVLTNTGTVDLLGDGAIYLNSVAGSTAVINANIFRKSGGTGTGTFNVPLTAQSGSQFLVQSGTLNVGAVTSTGATFNVSAGATLAFNTNDTRTFDAATTLSGAGTTYWSSGTSTVAGTISASIAQWGGTLTINSAAAQSIPVLSLAGGTLNGSAPLNVTAAAMTWSGGTLAGTGTLSIPSGTTLTINGYPNLSGRPLTNAGTININNGYYFYLLNNAVLTNTGTIDLLGDGAVYLNSAVGTTSVVNSNIIRKSGGTGGSTINVPLTAQSGSQFNVQSGTFYVAAVNSTGGTFNVSSGATLNFNTGDTRTFDAASTISGAGLTQWASGTNTFSGTITTPLGHGGGTLAINSAAAQSIPTLALTGGTVTGSAGLTITGSAMTWTGGTVAGSGALTISSGATITINGYPVFDARPVTNAGTININNGYYLYLGNNAVLTNSGTIDFAGDGNIALNSVLGSIALTNNGFIRKSSGTGTATISIPVTNSASGTIRPTTGTISFTATLTQAGTLSFPIAGASLFGKVHVNGAFPFGGTLAATTTGGYTPTTGTTFQVLTYGSQSGTFPTKSLTYAGGQFTDNAAATALTLTAQTTSLTVTTSADSGAGSLRDAITQANSGSCSTGCLIGFAIGTGAQTIALATPLPTVTAASVTIDGTTQPGYAGSPIITLAGGSLPAGAAGLQFTGSGGTARGLSIVNFGGTGSVGIGVGGSAVGVQILGNSMSGNTLGIDLGMDGPTANDAGDGDTGANSLQNHPVISSAIVSGTNLTLTMTVDSPSTGSMLIEVFRASGSQGDVALGAVCRATPITNDVFAVPAGSTTAGQGVVATATSHNGAGCASVAAGTSEFSPVFTVAGCTPPNATITAPAAACAATPGLSASIPAIAGATYAWTITNGTITSAANTSNITFTAGTAGTTTLNVTITDIAGCANAGSHNVAVSAYPVATITAPSNVCSNTAGHAASVPATAGATYAWTITNGTITSATNANAITFTAGSSGTTTLNVTVTANGCATNGTHNATIDPVATAAISAPASACPNTTGIVASVPFTAGATYAWTITNGTITSAANANSISFTAGASGTTTLNVTATLGSCVSAGTHNLTISAFAPTSITAPASTCPNATGLAASVPATAGATYAWTITNGTITSAANVDSITFDAGVSGTTTLSVTVTTPSSCVSSATHNVTINPSPVTTITAPASVCAGSTGNAASVAVQAGATYAWTITNGTITSATNGDTIAFTAGATGNTTLNVTVTAGGCTSNGSHNASIAPAVTANVTAPVTACAGSAGHVATVNSTAGATYNWSVTNGTITSGQGGTSITFSVAAAGTTVVSVQVTSGGCTANGSQTVAVNPVPSSAITAPGATCPSATGLSASVPTTAGATYAWSIANGTITSATNTAGITFTAAASGTTTLNVTVTASGCVSTATHNVAITANPTATVSGSPTSCPGAPGNSASVPSQAGATYAWSITNGTISSATNGNGITFTAGTSGVTTVSVVVTANGCTSNGSHNVTITPPPSATISAPASVCANATANASVPNTAGATYGWTITNGTITSATNTNAITFTAGPSGNVVLGVTVTAGGCSNTGTQNVATTSAPTTTITAPASTCPGTAGLSASASPIGGATYAWSITNGTITSASNTNAVTFTAGASGTTTLNVTVNAGGCVSTASHNVTIGANPTATITAPANVCANASGNTANVAAQAGATYTWTIGNGTITAGQGTSAITFTAAATGNVTLGVTVNAAGCTSTGNTTVPIVAALAVTITGPSSVCPGATFTLDAGPGFTTYSWSNGGTARTTNVSQSVATTYTVTVSNGTCSAQASKTVTMSAAPTATITAPSLLQPNATGNNASVAAQAGATYAWVIGNGVITSGQGTNAITFSTADSGSVDLSVTVTLNTCTANASASIPIQSAAPASADLTVTKSAPASVQAGQTFTYTIEVINNGPSNADSIAITDELPAGLTLIGVNTGWPCTTNATTVRCTGQTAVVGPNSPIAITVRAPSQNVTLTNTVTIGSLTPDPNAGNNAASATTQVIATPTCATVPPSLESPSNNASGLTSPVTFSWTAVTGASTYELWLADSLLGTTSNLSFTSPVPSGASTWFVVARLSGGCDALVSERRTFTVATAPTCGSHTAPQITAPSANATVTSPVTISWTAVPQAIGYRVLMSVNGDALQELGSTGGAISLTANVPPGSITIVVDALFSGCPPTRSASTTFTVSAPDPCVGRSAATLVFPANNASVNSSSVEFRWSAVANADQYRLWASLDGAAAQIIGTTDETSLRVLVGRGEVIWWIQTLFDGCPSTESSRFRFTIPQAEVCANTRPDLIAPAHNATVTSANVTFNWSAIDNAIGYELWLTLEDGAPTLFGTTATTSLTREVPAGDLEWFVRVRVDRCDPRDSQKSKFTYVPPANCAANERPMADAPAEDAEVASPVAFRWSAPAGATRYELYVIRGNSPAALAGSSTNAALDNVSLASGNIRWFVRAFFGTNCPALDSVDQSLTIVATPQACSSLDAPTVTAPGQISSGVPFRIRWSPIPGATSYQLQIADNADFTNAESLTTSGTEHELVRTNAGVTPLAVHARVRAIDTRCSPAPALSLFGPTAAIFVLPVTSNDGSLPASSHGIVTFTIPLGPELAGQTFTAVPTQPWLTVTPASGVVGPTGTILTVTANTAGLPIGASLGGITITTTTPTANGLRGNGTSTTTKPVTISLVTPVAPANRNTPPPDALIIPAVANADGINAHFQSDVRVTNASAQPVKYQLTFTPSGEGLTASKQTTMSIDPGRTIALDDVLKSWFGTGSVSSTGTLEVRPLTQTSTTAVPSSVVKGLANLSSFASSRTFNATSTGTYGQYIPAIPFASFVGKPAQGAASILSLQQIAQSAQYRTNLGLLEATGESASLMVSVFGQGGAKLTSFPVELKGGQHTQLNSFLTQHGVTSLNDGRIEVQVTSGNGKVTAYASVLDNSTSDPLLVTPVSLSDDGNNKWVVPGVADLNNGLANWQTDLRVFNASTASVDATLAFYSQNGGELKTKNVTIAAGQVLELDKTLASVFNATNDGGAVHITTPLASRLIATARTYNQTSTGTYGQFISAVTPIEAAAVGTRALQILQVEESTRYRSNIGLAEVSGKPVTLEVSIITGDAKTSAFLEVSLGANEFRQLGGLLRNLGPEIHNARVTVRAVSGEGRVAAYASVIDMLTQDPTYVPAQ